MRLALIFSLVFTMIGLVSSAQAQRAIDGAGALAEFDKGMAAYESGDYQAALRGFDAACQYGSGIACYNLGHLHWMGQGTPEAPVIAIDFFRKACEGRSWVDGKYAYGPGCHRYAVELNAGRFVAQDYESARSYLEQSCALEDGKGCVMLGMYKVQGTGGEKNIPEAYSHMQSACEKDIAAGCYFSGYLLGFRQDADPATVQAYYAKACQLGHKDACNS